MIIIINDDDTLTAPHVGHANCVYKLPPIDRKNLDRCKLLSSSIGQANAARDSLYDLRECDIRGQNAEGKDQSGMIASDVSKYVLGGLPIHFGR